MFSDSVMISMIFETIMSGASIVIPLLLIWYVSRKKETGVIGSYALGVLAFFWSQILIPMPILWILKSMNWFENLMESDSLYVIYLIITQVVAAAFAVLGRVWCIWLMNRRTPSLYRAMSSAVGFATFAALSRIATSMSFYKYMKLINTAGEDAFKNSLMANANTTADDVARMLDNLKAANSFDAMIDGVNIMFVVIIEVALIVIIYQGYIKKQTVKASIISAIIGCAYSFIGSLINDLATEKMGNVISHNTAVVMYNAYLFACALAAIWLIVSALGKYKKAMAEGAFAQLAYFEKTDK